MEHAQPVTIMVAIAIVRDILCMPGLLDHTQVCEASSHIILLVRTILDATLVNYVIILSWLWFMSLDNVLCWWLIVVC